MASRRSPCPIAYALDIFGDKWSLLVVRDIAIHGKRHYGDFESAGERIATNILAARLKLLVASGVIERLRDPDNGSKRIYRMTPKGLDLLPMLVEMILWSAKYDPKSPVPDAFIERATYQREALLTDMRRKALDQA